MFCRVAMFIALKGFFSKPAGRRETYLLFEARRLGWRHKFHQSQIDYRGYAKSDEPGICIEIQQPINVHTIPGENLAAPGKRAAENCGTHRAPVPAASESVGACRAVQIGKR